MHDNDKTILTPEKIKIDVDSIPEYQKNQLVEWALEQTRAFFSRPGEESRYQAWLQKRIEMSKKESDPPSTSAALPPHKVRREPYPDHLDCNRVRQENQGGEHDN